MDNWNMYFTFLFTLTVHVTSNRFANSGFDYLTDQHHRSCRGDGGRQCDGCLGGCGNNISNHRIQHGGHHGCTRTARVPDHPMQVDVGRRVGRCRDPRPPHIAASPAR